jgi:glycosyltransferase involved in cell wall biosynthesis
MNKSGRILHVTGGLGAGGAETWLVSVLRHIDRSQWQFDFLIHDPSLSFYRDEVERLGSKVYVCPGNVLTYGRCLRSVLREGSYRIVHSHMFLSSGYVLKLAAKEGVPVRIAHAHNTFDKKGHSPVRRLRNWLMKKWVARYATLGIAVSDAAGTAVFGDNWKKGTGQVIRCGVETEKFRVHPDGGRLRRELGIRPDAFVVGHVGSFTEQKNHQFLLKVAAETAGREPNVVFLLVGEGSLRSQIERDAARVGLAERVIFAGLRRDVPELMSSVFDVFVLPSLFEGLPLVVIEAQAAGLPCVISDVVTPETDVNVSLIHRLNLAAGVQSWAEQLLACKGVKPVEKSEALAIIEQSPFNIERSAAGLLAIYEKALAGGVSAL